MTKNPFIDFPTYLGLDWLTLREVLKSTKKGSRKCVPRAPTCLAISSPWV